MLRLFSACFLFVLFFNAPCVQAQKVITGQVTDATTGEPLPAANLQIEGTYTGTITNNDGYFELRLQDVPAAVLVRFIGYETARLDIDHDSETLQNVALAPITYELEEVVVTGEDPAIGIMRRVIERKQEWRANLATYHVEAYNRFTMENDTGIVSIVESLTETFWDKERGLREIVKSQRQTSNMMFDEFLPATLFVTNLYDDDIEIAGYDMIGVTHPKALKHYRFKLEGFRSIDGKTVYDISVKPKNRFKSAFVGRVAVLDEEYALLEVELRPSEAFLFPPPIDTYDVTYSQQYSNFGGDYWLPVDFRSETDLKIKFPALLTFPTFRIKQVSRLTNYEVNVELPDSLYEETRFLSVDTVAVEADTLLNREGIAVPLSGREDNAYSAIDSTMTLEKAYKPKGLLARFVDFDDDDGGNGGSGSSNGRGNPSVSRSLNNIDYSFTLEPWFNRVDELHAVGKLGLDVGRRLSFEGKGGYKTGLKEATYGASADYRVGRRYRGGVGLSYAYGVDLRSESVQFDRLINSFDMLLYGSSDYFDYFGNEKINLTGRYRIPRHDVRLRASINAERHFSVPVTTTYAFFNAPDAHRPNPVANEGNLRSITIGGTIGEDDVPWGIMGQKQFTFSLEKGIESFGGDFDFFQMKGLLDWRFNTFAKRRFIPATLDVRLMAGMADGSVPFQRYAILDGNFGTFTPFGSFRTLNHRVYEGTHYAAVFWEHSFRTLPFELLGMRRVAELGWNLIVHGAHGQTWINGETRASHVQLPFAPRLTEGMHNEIGVSVSGLFGLFRIDYTRRLTGDAINTGYTIGLSAARIF